MRDGNEHLTLEEIRQVSLCQAGESLEVGLQEHVAQCRLCSDTAKQYEAIMRRLDQFSRATRFLSRDDCPEKEVLLNLAAGLLSPDEARKVLDHAGSCHACGLQLKELMEVVGSSMPPLAEISAGLKTATHDRQKKLGREMAVRSQRALQEGAIPRPLAKRGFTIFSLPLWACFAVVVVLLAAGLGIFWVLRPVTPEKLLAQAYGQQRTLELRIPQAGYGPVQVQRDHRPSQMSKPGDLLEAEALIKRGLEKRPNDPKLLRAKAEADLLNWDYQPAIETLGHALRLEPKSFYLLEDLGAAYFERAEATDNPADYEAALQSLSDALLVSPYDATALFNRAVVYERLFLYDRAIADWELLLTVEKNDGWRKEARKRLDDVRARQRRHSSLDQPEQLTLAIFDSYLTGIRIHDVRGKDDAWEDAAQEYIGVSERLILPSISSSGVQNQDQYRAAAVALARHLRVSHSDRFLDDLLVASDQVKFHQAARLLGQASTDNYTGHSEGAYSSAALAAGLFHQMHNEAGVLASGFEQTYALQFESRAAQCAAMSGRLVGAATEAGYAWLEIQFLLEQAICSNMLERFGDAKRLAQRAVGVAASHDYQSLYLRGLTVLATLEADTGDESSAWSALREGLRRYWSHSLPQVRAYSLYVLLETMAQRLGHFNVQYAAICEALRFIPADADHIVEAAERSRLGNAALRLGQIDVAGQQFSRASQLFSAAPETESVQWRKLVARIGLAQVQSLRGRYSREDAASLAASLPEIKRLSNRYVGPEYYSTLAGILAREGDPDAARRLLQSAIHDAEMGLHSLSSWRERFSWINEHRQAYLMMTELLFRAGQAQSALEVWERFRTASPEPLRVADPSFQALASAQSTASPTNGQGADTVVLTFAITEHGLLSWVRNKGGVHSFQVDVSSYELKRTAENFIEECARPDSDIANLRADAQALYTWLVQPAEHWLPETAHLIIEPDGILGILPFEALVTESGDYLGARYSVTSAPTFVANRLSFQERIRPSDHALIVSAPASPSGSLEPPPLASSEADRVAEQFISGTVLYGREATLAGIERDITRNTIFHFAGHARFNRNGADLLLADGALGVKLRAGQDEHSIPRLDNVKLAVFSACGTARPSEISPAKSLVSEFLHQGVAEVVASRWNVDSGATADYMALFYRSLLSGHAVAEALHTASQAIRTAPGRAHPYYWASFSGFERT